MTVRLNAHASNNFRKGVIDMSETEKRYTYEEMLKHPSLKKVTGRYVRVKNHPAIFKYIGKGVRYGIEYYGPDGRQRKEMIQGGLREAKEELSKKRELAKQGIVINKKITFREVAQKFARLQAGKPSFENLQRYWLGFWTKNGQKEEWCDKVLCEYFGDYRLHRIGPLDIENFKKVRSETPTQHGKVRRGTCLNRELELLRAILNRAVAWGFLDSSAFAKLPKIWEPEDHGRVRCLEQSQIQALLAACLDHLRDIVKFALYTGMRKGDILGLKWSNVNLQTGTLTFNEMKKGGKTQVKPLCADAVTLLMGIKKGESDYIFTFEGRPLKSVDRSFRSALKRAGIKDFHFHDLRHCSASWLLMRGASLKSVQEHLNHSSLAMTQRYAHLAPEFQKAEVERLNGLFTEATA
jgi:integrase